MEDRVYDYWKSHSFAPVLPELNKEQLRDLQNDIAAWFATHWRDDDNPKSEYRASRERAGENVTP